MSAGGCDSTAAPRASALPITRSSILGTTAATGRPRRCGAAVRHAHGAGAGRACGVSDLNAKVSVRRLPCGDELVGDALRLIHGY